MTKLLVILRDSHLFYIDHSKHVAAKSDGNYYKRYDARMVHESSISLRTHANYISFDSSSCREQSNIIFIGPGTELNTNFFIWGRKNGSDSRYTLWPQSSSEVLTNRCISIVN